MKALLLLVGAAVGVAFTQVPPVPIAAPLLLAIGVAWALARWGAARVRTVPIPAARAFALVPLGTGAFVALGGAAIVVIEAAIGQFIPDGTPESVAGALAGAAVSLLGGGLVDEARAGSGRWTAGGAYRAALQEAFHGWRAAPDGMPMTDERRMLMEAISQPNVVRGDGSRIEGWGAAARIERARLIDAYQTP